MPNFEAISLSEAEVEIVHCSEGPANAGVTSLTWRTTSLAKLAGYGRRTVRPLRP